jgi:type I restriction enzyme S subunit
MKVCLSEISEFITDGTHGSPERTETGVPVLSAQNVAGGTLSYLTSRYTSEAEYQAFKKRLDIAIGDVLLTIVGSIGRAAVVSEKRPAVFQRSVAVIRPKHKVADSAYLLHLFHSSCFQTELYRNSNQSSQAGVYLGRLGSIEIPLPPLEEQRRIAAILDKASAIRGCSEKAARNAVDLKASLFDEAFIAHDRHSHWEQLALGELCDVQGGLQVTSARSAMPIRVPYLRVANVLRGRLDLTEIKEINCSQLELEEPLKNPIDCVQISA